MTMNLYCLRRYLKRTMRLNKLKDRLDTYQNLNTDFNQTMYNLAEDYEKPIIIQEHSQV